MSTAHAHRIANESPFCEARELMKKLEDALTMPDAMHATHDEIERMVVSDGHKLLRALLQAHYDVRAAQEREVVVNARDRAKRERLRSSIRKLETLVGEVEVQRLVYQGEGVECLAPLEGVLALPEEKYSHELRRMAAEESAQGSFEEAVERIDKRTGAHVPKRQVEELTIRAAQDFDAYYADRLREPETETADHLVVLSFDDKGIATRHQDLREATRKAAEATPPTLHSRLAKGEKPNRKRMAKVATVYALEKWPRTIADVLHGLHDPKQRDAERPRPVNKRVWASIEHAGQRVIDDAFAEGLRRDPERLRRWVVLVDGHRDQIRRVLRGADKAAVKITIVLDIVHVLEYLWRAAYAFHADGTPDAEKWVEDRLLALLTGRSAGEIAKSLRGMVLSQGLDAKAARPVVKCAKYLVKNARWLHYDRALADGLPIATGVIEGACRHLVQDRMGRTGARWSLAGAEAVLRMRALRASRDFDDYWLFHLAKEQERNHASRYVDGIVPDPIPQPRPNLRIVK
ncbi:MAG TPA: ISKra4 family transposase [Polyangiaceae bacterium]